MSLKRIIKIRWKFIWKYAASMSTAVLVYIYPYRHYAFRFLDVWDNMDKWVIDLRIFCPSVAVMFFWGILTIIFLRMAASIRQSYD